MVGMSTAAIVARARKRMHESQLRIIVIESRNVLNALKGPQA